LAERAQNTLFARHVGRGHARSAVVEAHKSDVIGARLGQTCRNQPESGTPGSGVWRP